MVVDGKSEIYTILILMRDLITIFTGFATSI